jgi:hypothetical protein
MTQPPTETGLIEARRLRDLARSIVRTDLATLRLDLAERPLGRRVRDSVVTGAVDTAENAVDLALENRAVLALTLSGVVGWLFRKRLGALAHTGWRWVYGRLAP